MMICSHTLISYLHCSLSCELKVCLCPVVCVPDRLGFLAINIGKFIPQYVRLLGYALTQLKHHQAANFSGALISHKVGDQSESPGPFKVPHYGCCWFPQSFLYLIRLIMFVQTLQPLVIFAALWYLVSMSFTFLLFPFVKIYQFDESFKFKKFQIILVQNKINSSKLIETSGNSHIKWLFDFHELNIHLQ
jgi:hypothetical protein